MQKHLYAFSAKRLLHQVSSSSPTRTRHAMVRFQRQGPCDLRMWYQVCRIPNTKPDLLTELRSAIRERILADALTTATCEKQKLEEEYRSLLSRARVIPGLRDCFMELLLGEQRNLTWEEQKMYLHKSIQEKRRAVDGIEDVYYERDTANAMCVVDSGIPGIGPKGFTGSVDDVQLSWYGSRKPLLTVDLLL